MSENKLSIIDLEQNEHSDINITINNMIENTNTDIDTEKQSLSQDSKQKINVFISLLLESYRVLMGSFLLSFVPQKCGDNTCSMFDSFNNESLFSNSIFGLNIFTFFLFSFLYGIEVKRENKLINYLEVNRTKPVDNDSVGEELKNIDQDKIDSIWKLDSYYYYVGMTSSFVYFINAILSIIIISDKYYDSKTFTVLATNVLFMGLKVYDVFSICNTKKNVFYSAYLKSRVQFNDIDLDNKNII